MKAVAPYHAVYRATRALLKLAAVIWNRFESRGSEHVPDTGGCLIACNHASFLDPPLVGVGIRHRVVRFLARDTLWGPRLLGWYLTQIQCVPLDRTRGDVGALRKAVRLLKDGDLLCVFPEGTRSADGRLQPAKAGIGFLVAKAGVPVVPAYIAGTFRAYPRGARWIRPAKIRLRYGAPIRPDEVAPLAAQEDGYKKIAQLVMDRIAALKPAD